MSNKINISLDVRRDQHTRFSIYQIIHKIQIPDYQRNRVWTEDQSKSFIYDVIFNGVPIPPMRILCINRTSGKDPTPESCYLIDGLQRRCALSDFLDGILSIRYQDRDITCNDIQNIDALRGYLIVCHYLDGNHQDGIDWIDHDQRRVSHTTGDYLYRHRIDRDICKMIFDIYSKSKDRLNRFLNRNTLYGIHIIYRDEDFYPFIATAVAIECGISMYRKDLPSCWPDRDNILWLDRDDIKGISYDYQIVKRICERIQRINTSYSIQILIDILIPKEQHIKDTVSEIPICTALVSSGKNKGKICGNKAKHINSTFKIKCCGIHNISSARFT